PASLAGDYLHAPAGVSLYCLVVHERLAPAGDGRERRAQLVRDGGDELRLRLSRLAYLHGHVVESVHKAAYLVVSELLGQGAVAAVGYAPGRVAQAEDGVRHPLAEPEVRQQQQRD